MPTPDYANLSDYFPFPEMRPLQKDLLPRLQEALLDPKIRFIVIEAPTGSGKSPIAMTCAKASRSAFVTTANKFLQDQYLRDFSEDIANLKGRGNYECRLFEGGYDSDGIYKISLVDEDDFDGIPAKLRLKRTHAFDCGSSPCRLSDSRREKCRDRASCAYHDALHEALMAPITGFNFASALTFLNFNFGFEGRNLLVLDEAHNIIDGITNFVQLSISAHDLQRIDYPGDIPDSEDIDDYSGFIDAVVSACEMKWLKIEQEQSSDTKAIKALDALHSKVKQFKKLLKDSPENLLPTGKEYDKSGKLEKVQFKPIVVADYAEKYFFSKADKVLMLSATILDAETFFDLLGISPAQTYFERLPSGFPASNRPIYGNFDIPGLNRNNLEENLPKLATLTSAILNHEAYANHKGIIHGTTYKICDYLAQNLDSDRILYPTSAAAQKEAVEEHLQSPEPTVLLSPSMKEGVDLKGDLARFQVLIKMPFPYLGDDVLKRRMALYDNYYQLLTALDLVQSYGRAVRSPEDWAHFFVLDGRFMPFVNTNHSVFPPWFLEAVSV